MTKKVIFRADGNSTSGLGHLYRLFSLVEIIKDTLDFVFLTHITSTISIIPKSYKKSIIPETIKIEDEPQWLYSNFPPEEYIIIADGYQFVASYQRELKKLGYSLVYIDDLSKEHMFADLVINHSPYIKEKHYKKEAYTKLALGTRYALLRPLFLNQAKQDRSIKTIDSVFVCFGGADPYNLSLKAVQALLQISTIKKTHVVLGGAYKHQEIFDLKEKNSDKINLYRDLSEEDLIIVMRQCNFAIAPASTILFELSCIKMPILSGYYVDNQKMIYKGFLNNKTIYKADNMRKIEVSGFVNRIKTILNENSFNQQIKAQKTLFDDKIALRHLNSIKNLC